MKEHVERHRDEAAIQQTYYKERISISSKQYLVLKMLKRRSVIGFTTEEKKIGYTMTEVKLYKWLNLCVFLLLKQRFTFCLSVDFQMVSFDHRYHRYRYHRYHSHYHRYHRYHRYRYRS